MNIPKPFVKKSQGKNASLRTSMSSMHKASCVKSCFNLDKLLQFEMARQRALTQVAPETSETPLAEFVPHRVFVNYIDTFNGSHLVDYLIDVKREFSGENQEKDSDLGKTSEEFEGEDNVVNEDESTICFKKNEKFEVVGSLEFYNNPEYSRPKGLLEILDNESKNEFLEKLLTCGFIIYDITSDLYCHPKQVKEAKWILETLVKRLETFEKQQPKAFAKYSHSRVFILISTLLTWAKTKPIDPEDPSLPFTEKDFRKRKPHPNYKIHCELEKRVIEAGKKYPNLLKTIVIGSGIPYGYEEDVFQFLFKMAWQGSPFLPIFRPGNNIIPVIHIDSLSSVVHSIMEDFPKKFKYVIATDPHSVTLKRIVKLLAKHLGNGRTKMIDKEEAFLFPDIKQRNYDMVSGSINIVPGFILENTFIKWGTDLPFEENIEQLILQFKTARELLPIKIFIHGPPASGKTFMAKRLAAYYDIPHLYEKGVIEDTINELREKIKEKAEESEKAEKKETIDIEGDEAKEEEGEEDDDEETNLETLKENLRELEENLEKNDNKKLDEELLLRLFKEKLSSNFCKNKGYVIDGYPETLEETKILYARDVDAEGEFLNDEEQGGDISKMCNTDILPAYVESFDASDEFLINRVIKLPDIIFNQFEEHEMCRRLTEFRALNRDDNTPLNFYDEMDVHPLIYNVENDPDINMEPTYQAIISHIGPPKNYGQELSFTESILQVENEKKKLKSLEELKSQRDEVKKTTEERRQNFEKWMFLKNQEIEMEEKALLVMGMPLRRYLMKYIFPCLTKGLVEVARLRPDDPIDFLSEFLFRENPEGKMFQPDYEEREEKLAQAIKEFETSLTARQTSKRSSKKSFSAEKSVKTDAVSRVTKYKCSFASSSSKSTKSVKSESKNYLKNSVSSVKTKATSSEMRVCTCGQTPSLSTCSSDRTPSSASSCKCAIPEPCEPCDLCEDEKKEESCACPCPD